MMLNQTMSESMDIALLLVNISSTNLVFSTVSYMISSIINPLIENDYDIRLALIQLRSDEQSIVPIIHNFTESIVKFKQWLASDLAPVGQHIQSETIAIYDALRAALHLDWRTTSPDRCHENVVFLVTDGLPCRLLINPSSIQYDDCQCACDDLWTISNEFVKKNLTLVIVGVGQIVSICDSLYGAIAKNTGGEYIPLINASRVLVWCIELVITEGYTLSQSFRHINREEFERNSSYHYSIIQKRDQSKIKHCQMMAQKGAWLINHYHQTNYNE